MATKKQEMDGTLPVLREALGLRLAELGGVAGCTASGMLLKLQGKRPWKLTEAHRVANYLTSKYHVTATVEELFGLDDA